MIPRTSTGAGRDRTNVPGGKTSAVKAFAIKSLGGPDVAAMIWDAIEGKRRAPAK